VLDRRPLEDVLAQRHGNGHRVLPGEARVAEPGARGAGGVDEAVEVHEGEAVDPQVVADLVDGERRGEQLAEQAPVEADMVMGVPESGVPAAEGFARASGIPFGQGLVKNRYIGRSFIAPSQEQRAQAVRMKLNPLRENLAGKRVVVVDDSIVRGTTQKQLVRMLREAGATEVHLRITSPPVKWSCFYGIDTGDRRELVAANLTVEEIRDYLNVDSLAYVSLDRLKTATGAPGAGFCDACFTGDYPVAVPVGLRKHVLEEPAVQPPGVPVQTVIY